MVWEGMLPFLDFSRKCNAGTTTTNKNSNNNININNNNNNNKQQPFHPRATPCLPDKEILSARASSPTLWGEFIV